VAWNKAHVGVFGCSSITWVSGWRTNIREYTQAPLVKKGKYTQVKEIPLLKKKAKEIPTRAVESASALRTPPRRCRFDRRRAGRLLLVVAAFPAASSSSPLGPPPRLRPRRIRDIVVLTQPSTAHRQTW
jgi:hypothetical protein